MSGTTITMGEGRVHRVSCTDITMGEGGVVQPSPWEREGSLSGTAWHIYVLSCSWREATGRCKE